MASGRSVKRRAFFVDEGALRRAKKALGVATDAGAVRLSVERVAEMEAFCRFMQRTRAKATPAGFDAARRLQWAVIDGSVHIDHWERGLYEDTLTTVRKAFIVRHSAVVPSELRRGAPTRAAQRLVDGLAAVAREPWGPNADDWWEAGRLIRTIADGQGWERIGPLPGVRHLAGDGDGRRD